MKHLDEIKWELIYEDLFDRECPPSVTKAGTGFKSSLFYLWSYTLSEGISNKGHASISRFHVRYEDITFLKERFQQIDFYSNYIKILPNKKILSRIRGFVFGHKTFINDKKQFAFEGEEILHHLTEIHLKLLINHNQKKDATSVSSISSEVLDIFKNIGSKHDFLKIARIVHNSSKNREVTE